MQTTHTGTLDVTIEIDAGQTEGPLEPIWRFFGADEPNYAYMDNGRALLQALGELKPGDVYFRAHNLLTSGDGEPGLKWGSTNAYTEDADGNPVYDWTIVDRIFDAYLERGVRPYVQIGFMPEAMTTSDGPYRHRWGVGDEYGEIFTGWAYPPKDYEKWGNLVEAWARHCLERYGQAEVDTWWWQTWNEANIGYWQGTPEEFYKLHDYAIAGVRRALPTARVGGPDTAGWGGNFGRGFYEHCLRGTNHATGEVGTPIDFTSFHAKGSPKQTEGPDPHIRMGIANQLREIDRGFGLVASFPELKDKPIVIGESDPEGCAACKGPDFDYRNGHMYASYTAAVFPRKHLLADKHGVNFAGALTWAFTFEDQPYFAGFRQLMTTGQIPLAVLNVFRLMARMSGDRLSSASDGQIALEKMVADGVREQPDVGVMASRSGDGKVSAFLWHYHDDDLPGPDAEVRVHIANLPGEPTSLRVLRVDKEHADAYAAWQTMGSPAEPTDEQVRQLREAAMLTEEAIEVESFADGRATVRVVVPRHGVCLLELA